MEVKPVDSEKDLGITISSDLKSSNQCIRLAIKLARCLESWNDRKDD